MSDDLDDLLRQAMKTLDDQVPPGYFDDFSRQTLARLEDDRMHDEPTDAALASSSSDSISAAAAPPPPAAPQAEPAPLPTTPEAGAKPREEDSGLHDIRSLASSQRMRISSKRGSRHSSPAISTDDDLLASASGSWRAVALPEPAKMISLPELAELPSAREVTEAEQAASRAEPRDSKQKTSEPAPAAATAAAPPAAPAVQDARRPREAAAAVEPPAVTPIAAARAKPAAAAGAVVFVSTQTRSKQASMEPAAIQERAATPMPELQRIQPAPAAIAAPEAAAGSAVAPVEPKPDPAAADRGKATPPPEKPGKSIGKYVPEVVEDPKPPAGKREEPKKKPDPGDPDFDKLLKEAGYQEQKAAGPKLDRKSLSGDDIKKSMNAVAAKVTACYAGQQGTAAVKLTVAPTGQIQRVAVSGVFAGTPVGACVEAAVQGATFPPWDGGPQSVNYSYLLAE